ELNSYFKDEVWGIIDSQCISCHAQGQLADTSGSKLLWVDDAVEGFVQENLKRTREFLGTAGADDLFLDKPSGGIVHVGGALFKEDSDDYRKLAGLVEALSVPDPCAENSDLDQRELPCDELLTYFDENIFTPIVESKCIVCHVDGSVASNTNLVFVRR